jgi:hypothetical protein
LRERRNLGIGYEITIIGVLLEISGGERCRLGIGRRFGGLGLGCRRGMRGMGDGLFELGGLCGLGGRSIR